MRRRKGELSGLAYYASKMTREKTYRPRKLFSGGVIGHIGEYVAIPDKGYEFEKIKVEFDGKVMHIPDWRKAVAFRKFDDKFGGKQYTLGYFEWKPE